MIKGRTKEKKGTKKTDERPNERKKARNNEMK